MGKRSFVLSALIFSLCLVFTVNSAMAGSKQHERWKGVAIGVGAAILGSVILNSQKQQSCEPARVYDRPVIQHRKGPAQKGPGRWEIKREWVPASFKKVWNPGHYDSRGRWVKGSWIKVVDRPGYWTERRVWIAKGPNRGPGHDRYSRNSGRERY